MQIEMVDKARRNAMVVGPSCAVAIWVLSACAFTLDYPSPADAQLTADGHAVTVQSLHCASTGAVLAAGLTDSLSSAEGLAFFSSDRGATWRRASLRPPAPGVPLSMVSLPGFAQAQSLYMSGYRMGRSVLSAALAFNYEPGPWWTSSDGGQSWHRSEALLPLPPTTEMYGRMPEVVLADDGPTLLAVASDRGDRLAAMRSTDGGRTWRMQSLDRLRHYGSMVSNGRGQAVVSGRSTSDHGVVLWSTDAGATWNEARFPARAALPFRPPPALRLYRSPSGVLIAYNNDALGKGVSPTWLYRSMDDGKSWDLSDVFDRVGRIVGIAGDSKGHVVAITNEGRALLSHDGGAQWRIGPQPASAKTELGAANVVFSDDGVVVATLDRATIMRSTDRGETWRQVDSRLPDRQFVLAVHCTDGKGLIVVAGSGGMLTRSADWGATWQRGRLAPGDAGGP